VKPPDSRSPVATRVATPGELDAVTDILSAAFAQDPLWTWAFPDDNDRAVWWRVCIQSAMRYPWTWLTDDRSAASVWIPPAGCEMTPDEEATVPQLIETLCTDRSSAVMNLLGRFDDAHPRKRPHYYLSMLGIRPERRGQGLGMALLADNLALVDGAQMPAYLESSNPANNARYERLGFRQVGEFATPDREHTVATMWREPFGRAA
jgi:ribosomal protein S18 acetylase RimI-like enzyme